MLKLTMQTPAPITSTNDTITLGTSFTRPQLPFVTKLGRLILLLFNHVENSVKQVEVSWKSGFRGFLIFLCGSPPNVFVLSQPHGQC